MILPIFTFFFAHQQSEQTYPPLIPPTEEEHAKALELWQLARKSHGLDEPHTYGIGFFREESSSDGKVSNYYTLMCTGPSLQEYCIQSRVDASGIFIRDIVTYEEFFGLPQTTQAEGKRDKLIRGFSYPSSFLRLKPENVVRPIDGFGFEVHYENVTLRVSLNRGTNDVNRVQYQKYINGKLKWITKKYYMATYTYSKYYLPQAWTIDDGEGNFGPTFRVTVGQDGPCFR